MKGKILTLMLVASILALTATPQAKAEARIGIYGYVDKVQYAHGETGQLKIWFLNEGTESLILQNISVEFPWYKILPWEGNITLKEIDEVISVDGNKTYTFDFIVPDDGRVLSSFVRDIEVTIFVDKIYSAVRENIQMNIANPPANMALQEANNLVTLMTVQIIITIIAAIIIAAAIFLSGRKPPIAS